ncbi:hypothetical protein ACF06P_35600 [Streptomyces sp. NPDC015684]|uniref:hypothetical protein n=1 Tax=Streptomyces sp. NPDC015684 TaxID=3364963 RepID=UPI0036F72730
MPETTTAQYPTTSAEVAAAVLDAIEANPHALDMGTWFWPRGANKTLPPEQAPACGTTMCIAGWAAHVTGWTLVPDGMSGRKDGVTRGIEDIALDALGLTFTNLFYDAADEAIEGLRQIAGR